MADTTNCARTSSDTFVANTTTKPVNPDNPNCITVNLPTPRILKLVTELTDGSNNVDDNSDSIGGSLTPKKGMVYHPDWQYKYTFKVIYQDLGIPDDGTQFNWLLSYISPPTSQ